MNKIFFPICIFCFLLFYRAEAQSSDVVVDGKARFTVLTPTLIRMEYAGDSTFENRQSFNVINRNLSVPSYTTQVNSGWREIKTDKLLLRYKQNSGCFTGENLAVDLNVSNKNVEVYPWEKFAVNNICEAENAELSGGSTNASDHSGSSGSGFVAGLTQVGAGIKWDINNNSGAGDYTIAIRYANAKGGDGLYMPRTLSLYVDSVKTQISLGTTADWDSWNLFKINEYLSPGMHSLKIVCNSEDTYNVNIDWLAIFPVGADIPNTANSNLGGWVRSLDGQSGSINLFNGLLSKDGWYMIDDSKTAIYDGDWVTSRPNHVGGYQDGYFFGYGHNYKTALGDFYKITGNPPLLPKWAFGIWFSRYYAYNYDDYRNTLLPKFRSEKLPLDVLAIDTDWKSPNQWDGWNWNNTLFPDPLNFLYWTKNQGLKVTLNIHPSIETNDPLFTTANNTADGLVKIQNSSKYYFDFSNKMHAQAYFDLHKPFNTQGIRFWWLDWCDGKIMMSIPGLPGDTWINSLYAKNAEEQGLRGFAFSRIGNGFENYSGPGTAGTAWSEHRYTVQFTGDTYASWDMLGFESYYTIRAANIGMPYVSHDLGSFHQNTLADDMYIRWVQLGTFQPIFRLHSDHGLRLPWDYPNVTSQAENFIRLRHSLVPYIYSQAYKSSTGELPIIRGMYFDYPETPEAYTFDKQYMFGESMLVSPVVNPGSVALTQVWFPNGEWTNFFTNEKVTGPVTKYVSCDLNSMPVYVKAGGIVPLAPYSDYIGQNAEDTLELKVYTGDDGSFVLYDDEGENLNYKSGMFATTKIDYVENLKTLTINSQNGSYLNAPTQRAYKMEFYNINTPWQVTVNDILLKEVSDNSSEGWYMKNNVLYVHLNTRPVETNLVIKITVSDQTSNISPVLKSDVKIYPNPVTKDYVTIDFGNTVDKGQLNIYNTQGEKILSKTVEGRNQVGINTSAFCKGLYLVDIKTNNVLLNKKLIIE